MKKIGMLGGMSWESTLTYYKEINEGVKEALGGLHSGKILLSSVDFAEIEKFQHSSNWEKTAEILTNEALAIEQAGADFMILCTNTMHKVLPQIQEKLSIEILHIADATAKMLLENNVKKVALLGTKFTMQEDFYKNRLVEKFGIEVVLPRLDEQEIIHDIIYKELCLGKCNRPSRDKYIRIINRMQEEDEAQGVILGCTEIAMLIKQGYVDIPIFDTAKIHAQAAVLEAIS